MHRANPPWSRFPVAVGRRFEGAVRSSIEYRTTRAGLAAGDAAHTGQEVSHYSDVRRLCDFSSDLACVSAH
jgi:hypothetical protein